MVIFHASPPLPNKRFDFYIFYIFVYISADKNKKFTKNRTKHELRESSVSVVLTASPPITSRKLLLCWCAKKTLHPNIYSVRSYNCPTLLIKCLVRDA